MDEHRDEVLLARVLRCYKPNCRYLKSATVTVEDGRVHSHGVFEIPASCYIDDTGHLNAAEVNICFSQMLYYVIAMSVRERLGPVFSGWTMEEYWARQLPDILITRFSSSFRWPINPRRFFGELEFVSVTQRRLRPDSGPLISLDTTFGCRDDDQGRSTSEVKVAIVSS